MHHCIRSSLLSKVLIHSSLGMSDKIFVILASRLSSFFHDHLGVALYNLIAKNQMERGPVKKVDGPFRYYELLG